MQNSTLSFQEFTVQLVEVHSFKQLNEALRMSINKNLCDMQNAINKIFFSGQNLNSAI